MTAGTAPGRAAGPARTIFFGSGDFAVPILDAVTDHPRLALVAVVTAPDRPAGRSGALTPTPVAARARSRGLTVLQPNGVRGPEVLAELAALEPEIGVLADYGRMIPAALLDLPRLGILGVHPSRLPRHRGATPIPATILEGDEEAAVTIYRMDAGLDTGPVLAETVWPLHGNETAPDLESIAALNGAGLLTAALPGYLDGAVTPTPQDHASATVTALLRRDDARLDPSRPAAELERQLRAHAGWPGSFVETNAGRLAVIAASVAPSVPGDLPATIAADQDGRPVLATAAGRLVLERVQPAGGREMSGAAFLRGHPGLVGTVVRGAATVGGR